MPARERNPFVLKLDTFVETSRRKPVSRGPRLHTVQASFRTQPEGVRLLVWGRRRGVRVVHSTSPGWTYESGCHWGAAVARRDACNLDIRRARTMARCRPWALSRRQKGGSSSGITPFLFECSSPGDRRIQLAFATEDPSPGDEAINCCGLLALSNCRDASLTIWPNCLCCRHRYAGRRE